MSSKLINSLIYTVNIKKKTPNYIVLKNNTRIVTGKHYIIWLK